MAEAGSRGRGGARRAPRSVRGTRGARDDARTPSRRPSSSAARPSERAPLPALPGVPTSPTTPTSASGAARAERPAAGGDSARPASPAAGRPGRRALRPAERRTRGLGGTLGLTFVGAVVPGTGYLFAGRKAAGWIVLAGWAVIAGGVGWYFGSNWRRVIELALDPTALKITAAVIAVLLTVWVVVVWTSYRMIRPRERPRWHTAVGNVSVILVCVVMALPVLQATRYAVATADAVDNVFGDNASATTPDDVSEENPWGDRKRVNVLLLGGDGGKGRDGVRTDSVILLSIDTRTGRTVTFSLPRNMEKAQFPPDSPLAEVYPYGFSSGTPGDGDYMLNAVYRNVPSLHPGVLGKSSNEGADALKQAVEGTLGIPVEYYVLVNLDGFKQIVDALGGVTVNVNEPVAIGGNTDAGIPPDDYLEPGPDQHLDGFHALWYARGRWGSDDYERMERQRCMIDAIIASADPSNLLIRYLDLVKAGKEIVYTDIPQHLAPSFVDLALKVKDAGKFKSVVFKRSDEFNSGDPDFDYVHDRVYKALHPKKRPKSGNTSVTRPDDTTDACAYQPETDDTTTDATE
jgi:LCP family protein required for cell wall assembly